MNKSNVKFRIAAKTDVGNVRQNNEDNFQASADLNEYPMRWVNNEICSLGEKGALLVVADGMGGMNAGEVASEIAIETVKEYFHPQNITDDVMKTRYSIEKFMNSSIEEADARIKKEAKQNPESKGMGTTIVIGWILNDKLYVSWCGDSRAYVYNPNAGLHQISKDHSYVQTLVDKGAIDKEDAFDYPESNIITKCLCDSSTKAKPESLLSPYEICNDDIIILCTDGLSGMIRDNEIENVIRNNEHDMDSCTDSLIKAACDAEGSDNITICVAQILQGAKDCDPLSFENYDRRLAGPTKKSEGKKENTSTPDPNLIYKKLFIVQSILILVALIAFSIWKFSSKEKKKSTEENDSIKTETLKTTIDILDNYGYVLNVERSDGSPQVGDCAKPDGKYYIEGDTIIEVKNEVIVAIRKDTRHEVPVSNEAVLENNGTNSILGGLKIGSASDSGGEEHVPDSGDGELTPVKNTHTVQEGETLNSISEKYKVDEDYIKSNNPEVNFDSLIVGTQLTIPAYKI